MDTDLDAVEAPFIPQNQIPTWTPFEPPTKKEWKLWAPFATEFYHIIDNPKRLPTVLHPFISKERAFTLSTSRPTFYNFPIYVPDEHGVHRRLYINLCHENLITGAFGATLIGITTRHYIASPGRLRSYIARRFLLGRPVSAGARIALTGGMMTTAFCWRLVNRAVTGGFLYDILKRSQDEKSDNAHWLNAGISGAVCGIIFGIKGGLPHAWASAAFSSMGAALAEFVPVTDDGRKKM